MAKRKKDRRRKKNLENITHKTKDRVTRTHMQLPCFSFSLFYLIHLQQIAYLNCDLFVLFNPIDILSVLSRGVLDRTLCGKVCQCLATGRWFSPDNLVSSTNITNRHDIINIANRHDISEILLKVMLSPITLTPTPSIISKKVHRIILMLKLGHSETVICIL